MPRKLNEMAIIITGRYWTAQYEWYAHKRAALDAGLSPAIVDAIQNGRRPAAMSKEEEAVYNFCTEVLNTKHASDAAFLAAKDAFGEKGVVDLMGVMSWYQMVSMLLNVDRYPMPDGVTPELKPLS
jgi:4-carboxymuconolactone decarboxylase